MVRSIPEIVETYFRLVNAEKFEALFELFHPEVEFRAPFGFRARGLEKVKPFYLSVPVNYPEHVDTPLEVLTAGNRAAVLIDFRGRNRQGTPVVFRASDWFGIENGRIRSLEIFFDSQALPRLAPGSK